MAGNFEQIGVEAIVRNLQGYLNGIRQMDAANLKLITSQLKLATTSITSAAAFDTAAQRTAKAEANVNTTRIRTLENYNNARIAVATAIEKAAAREVAATAAVARAQTRVAQVATGTAIQQTNARAQLERANRTLDNARIASATAVAAAEQNVGKVALAGIAQRRAASAALTSALRAETVLVESTLSRLATAQVGVVTAGGRVVSSFNLMRAAALPFRTAIDLAHKATTAFGTALIAMTGFSNRFAVAMRFGALAVGAFASALIIGVTTNFQDTLIKIDNLTELTTEEVARLRAGIIELSKSVPKSPDELGAAAYEALSRGITDVEDALDITEIATKAAVAGFADQKVIVEAVTGVMNAYGHDTISAKQATEILFAAVKAGAGEFDDFANQIGRVSQLGRNLGVPFNELAAAVATLTNVGVPAANATTALLGILNQISSPSAQAEEALASVGTSIQQVRINIRDKGLIPALQELIALFGNNQVVLEELFPEVRAYSGALALLGTANVEFNRTQGVVNKSVGIVEESFQNSLKSLSAQVGFLKNVAIRAFLQAGTQALPTLTKAVQDLRIWLERNSDSIIKFASDLAAVGARIGRDFLRGVKEIVNTLQRLNQAFGFIVSNRTAITLALAAIFAVFLPGSKYMKGLLLAVTLIGELSGKQIQTPAQKLQSERSSIEKELRNIEEPKSSFLTRTAESIFGKPPEDLLATKENESGLRQRAALEARLVEINKELAFWEAEVAEQAGLAEQEMKPLAPVFEDVAISSKSATDALEDGIISFEEAAELGISAAAAGALEASRILDESKEKAFEFAKALSRVANGLAVSRRATEQFVLGLARNALDAARSAASALFSRPTREMLSLEQALIRVRIANTGVVDSLQNQLDALNAGNAEGDFNSLMIDLGQQITEAIRSGDTKSVGDLQKQRLDAQTNRQREQERARIQSLIDKRREEEETIQKQLDLYNLQNEALQKSIEASDATLLSQGQLGSAASEVARVIAEQSGIVVALTDKLGKSTFVEIDEMTEKANLAKKAFDILQSPTLQQEFIPAMQGATGAADTFANAAITAAQEMTRAINAALAEINNIERSAGGGGGGGGGRAFQHGGYVTSPTNATLGENFLPEMVLPLTNPMRSRELLMSLPPSLLRSIIPSKTTHMDSLLGGFNVTGVVTQDMEQAIVKSVRRELARSRGSLRMVGMRA